MGRCGLTMIAGGSPLAAAIVGCGDEVLAPAAEPAVSPPLTHRPAGNSFAIGAELEGLVIDSRTGLAAAITRDPSALTIADLARRRVVERAPLPATGRHLSLASPGGPVLEGGREVATLPAPEQPGGVSAAGRYVVVVVVAVAERMLAAYDARSLEPLGWVPAGAGPTHVVAAGDRAWVADTDGDAIVARRTAGRLESIAGGWR